MSHPYDGCADCLERVRRLLSEAPPSKTNRPMRRATAAELERHARRFGPALVAETATEMGVNINVESSRPARPARRRTKGPTLKERVRDYLEAGHSVEVIAELENLSPSRARRLVKE